MYKERSIPHDHHFKPIQLEGLEQAFGSVECAKNVLKPPKGLIRDPFGALVMTGSFIYGHCNNPTSQFYGMPPDSGRKSDIDLILIDCWRMWDRERAELCNFDIYPDSVRGRITHSLYHKDGYFVESLTKPAGNILHKWLSTIHEVTGRGLDFRICGNWSTWQAIDRDYWLIAERDKILL